MRMTDEEKKSYLFKNLDFGSGIVKEFTQACESVERMGFLVSYRAGLCLELWWWKGRWDCHCWLKKEDTGIFQYGSSLPSEGFLQIIRHCIREIEDGKYQYKKTRREQIQEIVGRRRLTSFMNNTKWQEFCRAMVEEMPFPPPYIYKTLFERDEEVFCDFSRDVPYLGAYDRESFAGYHYQMIEWVKIRPRYYDYEGGRLAGKYVYHEAEQELEEILARYSIPYEKEDGVYMIYGYKGVGH